jgi:hypothetical protein
LVLILALNLIAKKEVMRRRRRKEAMMMLHSKSEVIAKNWLARVDYRSF